MHVYRLRIRPERAPEVWRVLEFSARHTLLDVHDAIQDAFELDDDHLFAFYTSGEHWDRASEVSHDKAGRVRLYQLGLVPGKRFSYVFDFGDELWHELEVVAASESAEGPEAPLLVESAGAAPPQYGQDDGAEAEGFDDELPSPDLTELLPLADELLRLLASEPDPMTDAGRESLRSAHRAASEFAGRLEGDAERFWAVEEVCKGDLLGLLLVLPLVLADAGMVAEAPALALQLSFIEPGHFLGDCAVLLAEAGQREAALEQVRENLESMADDPWVEIKAGHAYTLLGEASEAEALFRAALEHTPDHQERAAAVAHLSALLRGQQRESEASALEAAEQEEMRRWLAEHALREAQVRAPDPALRLGPKLGRNDPCPCGSGKKYKKCCGAAQ
jgi:tetratricopeptide (TPR) repeat protein